MNVITRFAPSPTGYLHIGSARTAIFNYLFARHYGGKFLLRIEDTDKQRSTKESIDAIFAGMNWLGIDYDGDAVFQSQNFTRHLEIANELLRIGAAYKCFMSQEEIDEQRNNAIKASKSFLVNSSWRDKNSDEHPKGQKYVIRIKAPKKGSTTISDLVQGDVRVEHEVLDDMVIVRADSTPTYMLSVVVDDYDMGVTHIIRGDDHLNNAFRQKLIYDAMGWNMPICAHIPLIHGEDGAKLSKRHGALGVEAYRDMGYLPDALFNYLLALGWSHEGGDVLSKQNAIKIFDGSKIGRSPARIDFNKMKFINSHYLRELTNKELLELLIVYSASHISDEYSKILLAAMDDIKIRSETILDLVEISKIYNPDNIYNFTEEGINIINNTDSSLIEEVIVLLENSDLSDKDHISELFKNFAKEKAIKLGQLMSPIRCILTGSNASPSVFNIVAILGKKNIIERLKNYKLKI
jgi:glutamyl-tRNA synthetase